MLGWLAAAGAAGAAGAVAWPRGGDQGAGSPGTTPATSTPPASPTTPATPTAPPAPTYDATDITRYHTDRTLVVVELRGGNDGLATLFPQADGHLHDLRPDLTRPDEEVHWLDDRHALHPALAPLAERGAAFLDGVGTPVPDYSHFVMEQRWWMGDGSGATTDRTGFLGRLCDRLVDPGGISGVALGAPTPFLASLLGVTAAIPDLHATWFLTDPTPWFATLRTAYDAFAVADPADGARTASARAGLDRALGFADVVGEVADSPVEYPSTPLGHQLASAARLLRADAGVRVVHVDMTGYDTHDDQRRLHDLLMTDLADALGVFWDDLVASGLDRSTLVATTSEFGRRPRQNGSGTDHGSASMAMLLGPVEPGLHGDPPSLTDLDDTDNLRATVTMEEYLGTLAETWLGIPTDEVLPGRPTPLPGLLTA